MRDPSVTAPSTVAAEYAFSGLLLDEPCNQKMGIENSRGNWGIYTYYSCGSRRVKAKATCEGVRIRSDRLEPFLLDAIYDRLLSDELVEELYRSIEAARGEVVQHREGHLSKWKRELSRIESRNAGSSRPWPTARSPVTPWPPVS